MREQHSNETEEILAKFEDAQQLSAYVSTELDSLTAQLAASKGENTSLCKHIETLRGAQKQVLSCREFLLPFMSSICGHLRLALRSVPYIRAAEWCACLLQASVSIHE